MAIHHDIDATGQSLGRIASKVAVLLRGKDVPTFEPNIMPDVKVTITNLDKVVFKGTKAESTRYYRHSGFPGGLHETTLEKKWAKNPKEVLRLAVRGMLPPNRLRDRMLRNIIVK
jgi:large subunit ribosomal protein L13